MKSLGTVVLVAAGFIAGIAFVYSCGGSSSSAESTSGEPPLILHNAPAFYTTETLTIQLTVSDDTEVAFYVVRDQLEPDNDQMVVADPGVDSIDFQIVKSLSGGINPLLVMAADMEGNASKVLIEIDYEEQAVNCDDGNPCTDDSYVGGVGCVHINNTLPCDDGDACTTDDTCSDGICVGGPPLYCSDDIACTVDSCDSEVGCVYTPDNSFCDDGNENTTDTCSPGSPGVDAEGCLHTI